MNVVVRSRSVALQGLKLRPLQLEDFFMPEDKPKEEPTKKEESLDKVQTPDHMLDWNQPYALLVLYIPLYLIGLSVYSPNSKVYDARRSDKVCRA